MIGLRRAGLHGDLERKLRSAPAPEDERTRLGVAENAGDPERRARQTIVRSVWLAVCSSAGSFQTPPRANIAYAAIELIETHLCVAQRDPQAVVGPIAVEGREAARGRNRTSVGTPMSDASATAGTFSEPASARRASSGPR